MCHVLFEIEGQNGKGGRGTTNDLGGNSERLLFFPSKFVSGCTPDTPQSIALPSSSAPLITLHSSFVM